MKKQLSVTLACFLLASVTASAQGWRTYEEAAQGKAYEKSDCVTLLDSTLVSVQPSGQGSFAVCKVIKVQTPKGSVSNRVIKYDYDPLTEMWRTLMLQKLVIMLHPHVPSTGEHAR